jgi:putative holliday junction resolvase
MKLLGIDFGTKRIGLATGDTEVGMAFPLKTVPNDALAVAQIAAVTAAEGTERIVVGVPRRIDGAAGAGETELLIDRFVAELTDAVPLPIDMEDERMTSVIAERRRREAGAKPGAFDIDAEAAAVMLEGYLERLRNGDIS